MSNHLGRARRRAVFPEPTRTGLLESLQKSISKQFESRTLVMLGKRGRLYAKLIELNGEDHQRSVAVGELGELINELSKCLRHKGVNMRVCEEIADVEIMLEQLKLMHDPEGIRVPMFKRFKLERLAEFNVKGGEK